MKNRPLVTLLDGRQVSDASEEWRHECEARHVARLPALSQQDYLAKVHQRRGREAGQALQQLAEHITNNSDPRP